MRRALALIPVIGLLLVLAAPVAADTSKPISGTYKSTSSVSLDCVPQGARTTCTQTSVDVYTDVPPLVVVCVNVDTFTYSDRTGRGRFISNENGCSDPIDGSALAITVSRDQMTASLAPTAVTLFECDRRACSETRTVVVATSDTGGPVTATVSRNFYRDGTCTYRYSESALSAEVAGTLTLDDVTMPESGYAQLSDVKVTETCK
ncbi:MAG TPA: hypothetical protein VK194_09455 [Candidatus Deferrimicrobium sp.]|nr:hypothetical protein [Candidatus Deferrimicrobium sp.]